MKIDNKNKNKNRNKKLRKNPAYSDLNFPHPNAAIIMEGFTERAMLAETLNSIKATPSEILLIAQLVGPFLEFFRKLEKKEGD